MGLALVTALVVGSATMLGARDAVAVALQPAATPAAASTTPDTEGALPATDRPRRTSARPGRGAPRVPTDPILVSGSCVDDAGRPLSASVELFVDSLEGELLRLEATADGSGLFTASLPADSTRLTVGARCWGSYFFGGTRSIAHGTSRVELEPIVAARGRRLTMRCEDGAGRGIEGVTLRWVGRRPTGVRASELPPGERAGRVLGLSDPLGTLVLENFPVAGGYVMHSRPGYEEDIVFLAIPASGVTATLSLNALPPIRGCAPRLDSSRLRIEAVAEGLSSSLHARAVCWFGGQAPTVLAATEVSSTDHFELERSHRHWPILVAREAASGRVVGIAARSESSGRYETWSAPEETVLDVHVEGHLPAGTPLSGRLTWIMADTPVHHRIDSPPWSPGESPIPLHTGRTFVDCEAQLRVFAGAALLTERRVVLEPGRVEIRVPAPPDPRRLEVRVLTTGESQPIAGATVVLTRTSDDGTADDVRRSTDARGIARFLAERDRCYSVHVTADRQHGGAPAQEVRLPAAAANDPHAVEIRVARRLASLEVKVASRRGGAGYRIGLCQRERPGLETCLVSLPSDWGEADRAPWEVTAGLACDGETLRLEALPPGDYLVYATPLEEPRPSFLTLTTADCLASTALRESVRLQGGQHHRVQLRDEEQQEAFVRVVTDPAAPLGPLSDVRLSFLPCATVTAEHVVKTGVEPRQARHVGGDRFALEIPADGEYLVRADGLGQVPSTQLVRLERGQTSELRRDASLAVLVMRSAGAGDADLRLRIRATSFSPRSRAVPAIHGAEETELVLGGSSTKFELEALDPFAQYRFTVSAGVSSASRVFGPMLDSRNIHADLDRELIVRLE